MISKETIQQIQSRIDIIDIIGSFVKLKKRGTNYLGNCPFHNEKTPSFTVSPTKEIFKCFGCGKSGNAINFLMEHEKYSYVEVLKWLANKYNIEIEETESSPEYKALQLTSDSLYIINNFAKEYFTNALLNTQEGQDIALSYLTERGFDTQTINKFELGYNPQSKDAFTKSALEKKYNQDLLIKSGLIANRNDTLHDNYKGRIIFPIHNLSGKILGFGARIIKSNDKAPKYINTPENEIYIKSKILYGIYFARTYIDKADECLLVEGYTDVISLHQAGVENAVASGGTSLTIDQLRLIKKYTKNLTIIYDGDQAGIKAALRGLDLAVEEGLNVKLVLVPDNEDPDSYVKKLGSKKFTDFVNSNKKDFILFQLEIALKEADNDPQKKSAVVSQIAETISKINKAEDFIKKQNYIRQVSEILKIDESGLIALVNQVMREKIKKEETKSNFSSINLPVSDNSTEDNQTIHQLFNKDEVHEQAILRNLIEFGLQPWDDSLSIADYLFIELEQLDFEELFDNKQIVQMINTYKDLYKSDSHPTSKNFLYHENPEITDLAMKVMSVELEISPNWSHFYEGKIPSREELYKEEVSSTLLYLQLRKIKRLILENQAELERTSDANQQLLFLQTHQALKKMEAEILSKVGTVIFK